MEHAALHAILLTGLLMALGGPVAALWLFFPSSRVLSNEGGGSGMLELVLKSVTRWTMWGALAASLATFIDFFVDVAELKGQTVFGGADISEVIRFATQTTVGQLSLACLGLLLLVALVSRLGGALGKGRWWLAGALAWGAIIATSDVSHAAAQPGDSMVPVIAQIVHITAAALWMGVLIHIFLVRGILLRDATGGPVAFVAGVVRKFSPLALATPSQLGITGVLAAWRYLQSVDVFFQSPYGLALVVKLIMLSPAIYAGFINFRYIRPALARLAAANAGAPETRSVFTRLSRMLELEVTAGVLVIAVAGILGSISPPGDDGSQRLTPEQAHVFLQPHRPITDTSGWALSDDPRGIPVAELRYDEFTHNWSGTMVILMGLCWLVQSTGGRAATWAWRIFPFLMVLFGLFIDLAGNPELLILRRYNLLTALANPILLEHQIGGLMVFILAWLTWRDRKTAIEKQPLGYPLPIIMIVGSLLLLGHAHSLTRIPDDLTNLINTQHAVFGALVLFAGTTRLFMLRGLVPARTARFVWPSFVIALGVFMAFFYREVV
jgi:putative copper export protein